MYLRPDEYHQSFNFDFLITPWEHDSARAAIAQAVTARSGGRFDTDLDPGEPRRDASCHPVRTADRHQLAHVAADRSGRGTRCRGGLRRARAATLLLLALPGSAYIYQGEELGLPEVWDLPPEVLDDPVWENSEHQQKGRDGCRVPIPWTIDGPSFGFGDGPPWLPQPAGFGDLSVEAQEGRSGSTLELYRSALAARSAHMRSDESLEWLDLGPQVLAFRRGSGAVCVTNFGPTADRPPTGRADRGDHRRQRRTTHGRHRVGAAGHVAPDGP